MKSIEGSETRFVDLDEDTLRNVLGRVDVVTLGRAACVNKLWLKVAWDEQLWKPIIIRYWACIGGLWYIDRIRKLRFRHHSRRRLISAMAKPPPDFYSIDFSKKIRPWR